MSVTVSRIVLARGDTWTCRYDGVYCYDHAVIRRLSVVWSPELWNLRAGALIRSRAGRRFRGAEDVRVEMMA